MISKTFLLLPSYFTYNIRQPIRYSSLLTVKAPYVNKQMEYIKSATQNNAKDWDAIRKKVVTIPGSINEKNISGVMLKTMISLKQLGVAKSFAEYLKKSGENLNLGTINGILSLYHRMGMESSLTEDESQFILDTYKSLYVQYEVLDSTTCERLLHALCVIDEWEKAMKVLEDICASSTPTHSAYSFMIATLYRLNRETEALMLTERSICHQRSLQHIAYEAWINYILRKYRGRKTVLQYLDEICLLISKNGIVIPEETAEKLKITYGKLGCIARYTKIRRKDGQCVYCKTTLDCLKLSDIEFLELQRNVKDKIIVGSDILLKSNADELKRFTDFMAMSEPYDIVLDALNICYAARSAADKVSPLIFVVEQFRQQNKKILLIGRKHMLNWPKMKYLLDKTCTFFTDDVSQDDPYFIAAAIMSGAQTDIVSKDLLRGHRFQLQDMQLRNLFQRWQWQHQWRMFISRNGSPVLQPPLSVTPCAQKKNSTWHLPFERAEPTNIGGYTRDGTPDWGSWLCIQFSKPNNNDK